MKKPFIYAACDTDYYLNHGVAFSKSAASHGHQAIIHITPNFDRDFKVQAEQIVEIYKKIKETNLLPHERQFVPPPLLAQGMYKQDIRDNRAYYACLRFFFLPILLEAFPNNEFLVLDIDSYLMDEIYIDDDVDLGLYLRENNDMGGSEFEKQGMKVAAGAIYVTSAAKDFVYDVAKFLEQNESRWFIDQHAIYQAYQTHKNSLNILDFSKSNFLDWEFKKGSKIWTGKGDRKNSNQTYLNQKKIYEGNS